MATISNTTSTPALATVTTNPSAIAPAKDDGSATPSTPWRTETSPDVIPRAPAWTGDGSATPMTPWRADPDPVVATPAPCWKDDGAATPSTPWRPGDTATSTAPLPTDASSANTDPKPAADPAVGSGSSKPADTGFAAAVDRICAALDRSPPPRTDPYDRTTEPTHARDTELGTIVDDIVDAYARWHRM